MLQDKEPSGDDVNYFKFNPQPDRERDLWQAESEVEYLREELRAANRRIDNLVERLMGQYNIRTQPNQTQPAEFKSAKSIRTPSSFKNHVQSLNMKMAKDKVTERITQLEEESGLAPDILTTKVE